MLLSDELSCIMQINADVTDLVGITQMMYHLGGGVWRISCIKPQNAKILVH